MSIWYFILFRDGKSNSSTTLMHVQNKQIMLSQCIPPHPMTPGIHKKCPTFRGIRVMKVVTSQWKRRTKYSSWWKPLAPITASRRNRNTCLLMTSSSNASSSASSSLSVKERLHNKFYQYPPPHYNTLIHYTTLSHMQAKTFTGPAYVPHLSAQTNLQLYRRLHQ